ncbi:BQ2448_143 [Microbotryum intermedium]|uniref:BQ2448_143 protein n=1 Tax=Microbotryum intermedium TaxID=269621 RepID=A0A238F1M4_9BASI|nr:BQ2448_143 [Microbotryum intermedium]
MTIPTPTTIESSTPKAWRTTTCQGDLGVLTYEPLHQPTIEEWVKSPKAGAVVTFTGYTRDSFRDKTVTHLEYETYPTLALKTLHSVLEAARRLPKPLSTPHPGCHHHHASTEPNPNSTIRTTSTPPPSGTIELTRIAAYHLLGPCPVGTPSIIISVSSPHRKEAYVACEYVLEEIKNKVQVWKREFYASEAGKEGGKGEEEVWVGRDGKGPEDEQGVEGEVDGSSEQSWQWKANNAPISTIQEQETSKER